MKILYHHRTLGDGAEGIHISEMVKAFRGLGHEVTVAGPVGELQQTLKEQSGVLSKVKRLLPGALFEMLEVGYSFYSFLDLSRKAKRIGADLIYDRYITFNAGPLWAARRRGIPLVLEVNAPLALERSTESDEKLYLKGLAHAMERYVCSKSDVTLVVSTPLKEYLESVGVPKEKCVVLPNGVDRAKFHPREKNAELMRSLGIAQGAVVIGFTGILRPWHGVEMLVKAVGRLRKAGAAVFLLVVGDGPITEQLAGELEEAGLRGAARITGRVPHREVADYVALFDVAVSPKATFYASPMKIVEYMAQGKPVVAPRMPNIEDLVADGENGLLFEPGDVASLAAALELLSREGELRKELGGRALAAVNTKLNWTANARLVIDYARKLR